MRKAIARKIVVFIVILSCGGCEKPVSPEKKIVQPDSESQKNLVYSRYSPVKADILPLTGVVKTDNEEKLQLNLYISLLDAFGTQLKSPCIFRLEMYQKVQRSAEVKGVRLVIWPDMNLVEPEENNKYWRNYLRAYEFSLPLDKQTGQSFIVEVTCLCPNDKRLTADFTLDL
jgi:hypothetical protein